MASMSERATELLAQINASGIEARWEEPEDLARRAREAIADAHLPGRTTESSGTLRLTGSGVTGSSVRLSAVADVMSTFQRTVTALGAAREGFRALRGSFPSSITSRTNLRLVASPFAGSVLLDIAPEALPSDELRADGNVPLIDEQRSQLLDESVADVITLLEDLRRLGPDADESALLAQISERGARFATSLRDFAKTLSANDITVDAQWSEPGMPTRRGRIGAGDAARLASLIAGRELDHEPIEVVGVLHTVSDRTALAILTDDDEWVYLKSNRLSSDVLAGLAWGVRVRAIADVSGELRPGGETVMKFSATHVERIDDADDSV